LQAVIITFDQKRDRCLVDNAGDYRALLIVGSEQAFNLATHALIRPARLPDEISPTIFRQIEAGVE
jgi:hypothetical protein